jgi:phospholipid/cholesterol/gamma-HCH transport system substrate-binding protein
MRSRTVREGSVGLFFLLGLGLFAALVLWLRNAYFDNQSYKVTVAFENAAGLQIGTPVRYRGVTVGRVTDIQAGLDKVNVGIRINQPDLVIPRNVKIEANQSGLIGQNAVDIVPIGSIPANTQSIKPLDPNCKNSNLIVCNNENLKGQIGISLDQLIRLYSDEKFFNNVNTALQNASAAAVEITKLSRNLSDLSVSAKQQLTSISAAANSVGRTADKFGGTTDKLNRTIDQFAVTANQINATANRTADQFSATANQISNTADKIGNTADRIGNTTNRTADQLTRNVNQLTTSANRTLDRVGTTADQFSLTARQAGDLATNLNTLVTNNQASLVATLDNLSQTSAELRTVVKDLGPAINRVTQGELIRNLETLSANAAQTSANLRDLTNTLNNPFTLLVLQQTLDSARVTFQNAQKITSDLDDLTGDPAFRNNLRNLVNGLSSLVSSTNQLQQQVEVAQFLTPMAEATNLEIPKIPGTFQIEQAPMVNLSVPLTAPIFEEKPKPIIPQPAAARE